MHTTEQAISADKKAISASKKTISANDPGGQTAAVGAIAAKSFRFVFDLTASIVPSLLAVVAGQEEEQ
jgi:hypothetical protein